MKRMLMLASVASMIDQFNIPNIKLLLEMGYEVHVACNFEKGNTCTDEKITELKKTLDNIKVPYFQIDFSRNVLMLGEDLKAYSQVLKLTRKYKYRFIHCHSPIGGVVGRLVGHKTHTKVVYTAHGFHFFKGAPIHNWLIYYPIEKFLSRWTDVLITINKEDYHRAQKNFFAGKVSYIPGVGVDIEKFRDTKVNRNKKRQELGLKSEDIVLISVGELNKNKNHEIVIRALVNIENPNVQYLIVGQGELKEYLLNLANKLGVKDRVHFLGFREDVNEIYKIADIFIFPSQREGLGLAAIEAMASGLPLIATYIHGIKDYINDEKSGYKFTLSQMDNIYILIEKLINNPQDRWKMGENNIKKSLLYDLKNIQMKMKLIYDQI